MNWAAFFGFIGAYIALMAALFLHVRMAVWLCERFNAVAGVAYAFIPPLIGVATLVGIRYA